MEVQDLHSQWLHWRRVVLEDPDRAIYNVRPDHVCRTIENSDAITVVNKALNLYGCLHCGRLHECHQDASECPLIENPDDMSRACAFSGRTLSEAESVIGVYELEQLARTAFQISSNNKPTWTHMTKARDHQATANQTFSTSEKSRHLRRAANSAALEHSNIQINKFGRKLKDSNDVKGVAQDHGNGLTSPGQLRQSYSVSETKRDCEYQERFFADMTKRTSHLKALFHGNAGVPSGASNSNPETESVDRRVTPKRNPKDGLERLSRTVRRVIQVIEVLVVEAKVPVRTGFQWLSPDERLDYYVPVIGQLLHVLTKRSLESLQDPELYKYVVVIMFDVLATTMRQSDSFGLSLIVWVADPWLAWCKNTARVIHLMLAYDNWTKEESKPYNERLSLQSRKRKRHGSIGGAEQLQQQSSSYSFEPEGLERVREVMKELPKKLYSTLVNVAGNVSHQGNLIRTELCDSGISPLVLYSFMHDPLL